MIILIPIKVKILKFYLKLLVRYRNINTNDTRKQSSRKHGHMSQGTLGKLSNRKSSRTWELVQIGGVVKKSKKSQVSVGNSSK